MAARDRVNALFALTGLVGRALAALAMGLLGALVLIVTADVVVRTAGGRPLAWVPSTAEYILLYAAFLPMPALVRTKGHVFVEFLRAPLPEAARRALEIAVYATCAAICAYLAWISVERLWEAIATGAYETRTYDMPRWLIDLPMATGFALSCFEWLRFLAGADSMYRLDPRAMDGY